MKIKLEFKYGSPKPPWFYGLTSRHNYKNVVTFHIIPLNFLIRGAMFIQFLWDRSRLKPSHLDRAVDRQLQRFIQADQEKTERLATLIADTLAPLITQAIREEVQHATWRTTVDMRPKDQAEFFEKIITDLGQRISQLEYNNGKTPPTTSKI